MSFELWLAFCTTELVLCLIPGPAVWYVFSVAIAQGVRPSIAGSLGILTVNILYFLLSATGVAAIIVASSGLFLTLKWAGAAYLTWIGLKMLLSRSQFDDATQVMPQAVRRSFWRGIVVQGSNPKAMIFFLALLPQFINPAAPVGYQIFVLCVSSLAIEFSVLILYTTLVTRARQAAGVKFAGPLTRLGGACLVGVAAKMAMTRD